MAKLLKVRRKDHTDYFFHCPGCNKLHSFEIRPAKPAGFFFFKEKSGWEFDGNFELPSFSPSLNLRGKCHLFVRKGLIHYCDDSRHELAGKTIEMVDIPE